MTRKSMLMQETLLTLSALATAAHVNPRSAKLRDLEPVAFLWTPKKLQPLYRLSEARTQLETQKKEKDA
jgi:hypothetical protein